MSTPPISRRDFLTAAGVVAGGATLGLPAAGEGAEGAADTADRGGAMDAAERSAAMAPVAVAVTVNGRLHQARLDARTTLLDYLREGLDLTGAKKGCNRGECGACTVHLDGRRVNACLVLAASCDGRAVTSIEGLAAADGTLHPVQQAFVDHDGFQCGFCTPGQIMSAVACITEGHAGTDASIREWMSGNLCRCAAYPQIVDAVRAAAGRAPNAPPNAPPDASPNGAPGAAPGRAG